jgi:hypothetical protein
MNAKWRSRCKHVPEVCLKKAMQRRENEGYRTVQGTRKPHQTSSSRYRSYGHQPNVRSAGDHQWVYTGDGGRRRQVNEDLTSTTASTDRHGSETGSGNEPISTESEETRIAECDAETRKNIRSEDIPEGT